MKSFVSKKGYFGNFGGAFIPEMLYPNIKELQENYQQIIESKMFQGEFASLLKHYAGRPTPLYYARNYSELYNAHIYFKREDLLHTGAHKLNNTLGQILLAKFLGKKRIIAETGAGQHGVATATACALIGVECVIYMGEVDMKRQAHNVFRIRMLGGKVVAAKSGSRTLKDATNEALRDWLKNPVDTHYLIGSVVGPHPFPDLVGYFQSVISKEIKQQLTEQTGKANPDYVLACVGGGSNATGAFYHFIDEPSVGLIAAEAAGKGIQTEETAASLTLGSHGVIHACKTLLMQSSDGQIIEPYSISAGLDYPGIGPLMAHLYHTKRMDVEGITDTEALDAAFLCAKKEGIIPALESAHALAVLEKMKLKKDDVVVVNISGRGDKDMSTYIKHLETNEQN